MREGKRYGKWNGYKLYGVTLESNYPFSHNLEKTASDPELAFSEIDKNSDFAPQGELIYPAYEDKTDSYIYIYKPKNCHLVRIDKAVEFFIYPERINYRLLNPLKSYLVEISFLGEIMSIWLELRGVPTLHASAISGNGMTAAFLSSNKGGKSALAASLMQKGYKLLTDDILAIETLDGVFVGRPGYPQMRMWEDEAKHFLGTTEKLEIVHPKYSKRRIPVGQDGFGSFCKNIRPITALYLPERQNSDSGIRIEQISPRDAIIEIVRNSFSAGLVEAMGLQINRMNFFVQLAKEIPVRRIIYPSGFHNLPNVGEAVIEDMQTICER